jgi:two-component sensor histidine kinase
MNDQRPPTERKVERRYHVLLENMSEGFVVCEPILDASGRLQDYWVRAVNAVFLKRAPEGHAVVGRRQREIRPSTSERWFGECGRALAGKPVRFEFYDPTSARWYEVHMMRLSGREFGQFFVDVTERKRAEVRQAELFEELNHRVKNNLAVVSAILELQARGSHPAVREHLDKAVDRIRAIGDLHSALYLQKSTDHVDLRPYLEDLRDRLSRSLFHDGRVKISTSCELIALPISEAVSLGLIMNELVTNAAKHAFKEAGGEIRVSVVRDDAQLTLRVQDDGEGFATEPADGRSGLGLRVVRSLARNMGGEVRILAGPGATVEVVLCATPATPIDERQQSLL